MPCSIAYSDAGESRPTALPICEALLLELVKMKAMRLSAFSTWRSRASRAAMPARRRARSGSGAYCSACPASAGCLKLSGTPMMRPSNSGSATFIAVSSGLKPRSDASHCSRVMLLVMACSTGRSSWSDASTAQPGWVGPSLLMSPIANEVVLISSETFARGSANSASAAGRPFFSIVRRDEVNTGSALTPRSARQSTSRSMKRVLPDSQWAR